MLPIILKNLHIGTVVHLGRFDLYVKVVRFEIFWLKNFFSLCPNHLHLTSHLNFVNPRTVISLTNPLEAITNLFSIHFQHSSISN